MFCQREPPSWRTSDLGERNPAEDARRFFLSFPPRIFLRSYLEPTGRRARRDDYARRHDELLLLSRQQVSECVFFAKSKADMKEKERKDT